MKLDVIAIVGENCITLDDGEKVYALIHTELSAGRAVELDFSGVRVFASPFFNAGIGRLLKDFTSDELNRLVKVSHLNDVGLMVLKRVIENSSRYYNDPDFRKALDEVLMEQAEAV